MPHPSRVFCERVGILTFHNQELILWFELTQTSGDRSRTQAGAPPFSRFSREGGDFDFP
ncbi:hypothetical protein SBA1_20006 [Candidatus Sulfotelmatobacter kueseliae]|uniref:Uncharacterized protein n=1 Tax=Candidatus Sulfotelmatobacter kueseliae TaxID=2042962 RepID=A0A2U3KF97_9BACT|nr:hypothetical protein SBA1_20006 [Candidatus Sulfotelmatobacter kueseliae]